MAHKILGEIKSRRNDEILGHVVEISADKKSDLDIEIDKFRLERGYKFVEYDKVSEWDGGNMSNEYYNPPFFSEEKWRVVLNYRYNPL